MSCKCPLQFKNWVVKLVVIFIFFNSDILDFLILWKNFMWTWFNIYWRKNLNQECISSFDNFHEGSCFNKQRLGHLGLLIPSRFSFFFKFACFWQGFHIPRPHVMVFQNEDSSYANPLMDYVKQTKIIQWWHDFL